MQRNDIYMLVRGILLGGSPNIHEHDKHTIWSGSRGKTLSNTQLFAWRHVFKDTVGEHDIEFPQSLN